LGKLKAVFSHLLQTETLLTPKHINLEKALHIYKEVFCYIYPIKEIKESK